MVWGDLGLDLDLDFKNAQLFSFFSLSLRAGTAVGGRELEASEARRSNPEGR